ncbi:MAG: TetR/AcrR family transcriptional regulator [candidate division Zixibacteria bacterium]|nr:TetR/AcrR family transcriptional regulator [candidate division Zixibacteria bacterium]
MKDKRDRKNSADLILTSATEEFSQFGLAGARIDRIAKNSGVNKAMIYYHFQSKEKLYQTIIGQFFDQLRLFFKERIVFLDDPEEIFRSLSEFYNTKITDSAFIPILLREIASGGEIVQRLFSEFVAEGPAHKLRSIIENSIEQGSFRNIDSKQAIASFIGMNFYYLIMAPMINQVLEIKDEKDFREKRPEAIVDLFFNGIKAK